MPPEEISLLSKTDQAICALLDEASDDDLMENLNDEGWLGSESRNRLEARGYAIDCFTSSGTFREWVIDPASLKAKQA